MNLEKLALFEALKSTFLHIDAQEKSMLIKHNLSLPRFYVLLHIHNNPGINQMELTARMLCTKGNITRILQGMEADGLLERKTDPDDGRSSLVRLTEHGKTLLYSVYADYEKLVDDLMGRFEPEQIKKYNSAIQVIQNTLSPQALLKSEDTFKPILVLKAQGEEN
ncbi:MAG TPA: MarR family transcriptional regulator [Anaerolineaceae bacterium]|nr:MarR family transcriptional regulator [Anaerolineaceae bacterium]